MRLRKVLPGFTNSSDRIPWRARVLRDGAGAASTLNGKKMEGKIFTS